MNLELHIRRKFALKRLQLTISNNCSSLELVENSRLVNKRLLLFLLLFLVFDFWVSLDHPAVIDFLTV